MMLRLVLPGFAVTLLFGCAATSDVSATQQETSELMIQYGCPTCHLISGVPGAVGKVGPPLDSLEYRSYLAGTLPNTPGNLQRWLMHPQSIRPGTAMPEMGISPENAARISIYLEDRSAR
jgi:cytochrome c